MRPFVRLAEPDWWTAKQRELHERLRRGDKIPEDVLGYQRENKQFRKWFHELVREPTATPLCAYCDGPLDETSMETIDHFFPKHLFPWLALCWENLYPSCVFCNEQAKGTQWSCNLLRPDKDISFAGESSLQSFVRLFEFEPVSGKLAPAPIAPRRMRARVRLTIRVFQLNRPGLCKARKMRAEHLRLLRKEDPAACQDNAAQGPFKFVAALFLAASNTASASPSQG